MNFRFHGETVEGLAESEVITIGFLGASTAKVESFGRSLSRRSFSQLDERLWENENTGLQRTSIVAERAELISSLFRFLRRGPTSA